jgi:hypothetical protein
MGSPVSFEYDKVVGMESACIGVLRGIKPSQRALGDGPPLYSNDVHFYAVEMY